MHSWRTTIVPIAVCAALLAGLVVAGTTFADAGSSSSATSSSGDSDFAAYGLDGRTVPETTAEPTEPDASAPEARSDRDEPPPRASETEAADDGADPVPAVDETTDDGTEKPAVRPGSNGAGEGPVGTLIVITNFSRANVEVDGETYPAYSDDLQNRGMELSARDPHLVVVEYGDNEKTYEVELAPGEERMLMVELTGMDSDDSGQDRRRRRSASRSDDIEEGMGQLTVYARPRGDIYLSGEPHGERAPTTIEIEPGRHEVRVEYENGEMSKSKNVRVREGSKVKLFFRQDD